MQHAFVVAQLACACMLLGSAGIMVTAYLQISRAPIGFDPRQEKGMGLLGMEERVERLGGLLCIESQPGHGTVLSIHFPIGDGRPVSEKEIA